MTREVRIGLAAVAGLGLFVFALLVFGNSGDRRAELDVIEVDVVLAGEDPAVRYGDRELRIVGWYAELDADCTGDSGGADRNVAWLQRDCPLRVLLLEQPARDAGQAQLERDGLRLAAPLGRPFPSRPEPGGANLQLQRLVFVGRFDDPAAASCIPARAERCRTTFVVTDYDGYVR